jgi:hypothetical protein
VARLVITQGRPRPWLELAGFGEKPDAVAVAVIARVGGAPS